MRYRFPAAVLGLLMVSPVVVRGQNAAAPREWERRPEEARCGAAAPLTKPLGIGPNVQKSKLRTSVQPAYPPDAQGAGKIVLGITVNEEGAVYSVHFLRCPTPLREAVRAAVCQWRYAPTYLRNEPVAVSAVVELSYNFARYRL